MADATRTQPRHHGHKNQQSRRIVTIVPVVPKKFERKSQPANGSMMECPPPLNTVAKSALSVSSTHTDGCFDRPNTAGDELRKSSEENKSAEGQDANVGSPSEMRETSGNTVKLERELGNQDNPGDKDQVHVEPKEDSGNWKSETTGEPKSQVEERQKSENGDEVEKVLKEPRNLEEIRNYHDNSSTSEAVGEDTHHVATTTDLHNLMKEENGSRLPSPFDPHNPEPLLQTQAQLQTQASQSHLQYPLADSNLSYSAYSLTGYPSSYHITTPPTDDIISPTETDYRGYGHIPYTSLQHGYTPPTDPTPSPTNDSNKGSRQNPETSYDVQENSPTANRPSSPYSSYQAHAYGNVSSTRPPRPNYPLSLFDMPKGNPLLPHHYESLIPSPLYGRSEGYLSTTSTINSSKSQKDDTGMSTDTLRHHKAKTSDNVDEDRQSWAHGVSPTNSLGSLPLPYQLSTSEFYAGDPFAAQELKYESWRSATLHSLNQPITQAFPDQTPLTAHLLDQFDKDKYADIQLEVIHERDGLVMADFKLHSLIMAQNLVWQELLNASTSERQGLKLLQLRTNDRFITSQAIEGALRVFYGEPPHLFIGSCLQIDFSKQSADTSWAWMDTALAFAASGYLLGSEEVITRGLHIASSIINWDNIEKALSFALHSGLDPNLDPDHALRVDSLLSLAKTSIDCIPSAIRGASDSLRKRSRPSAGYRTSQSKAACSRRSSLLFHCLNYIIWEFPISWDLDVSACPLTEIDRLPPTSKVHSPSNKSKLGKIRFGDCPPEILSVPRPKDSILSSILLSLHFIPLKYILDHVVGPTRSKIIGPIVDERERRRTQVLKEGQAGWTQRIINADQLAYVGWKEFVAPKQDSYSTLGRSWTNFDEPHST